MAKHRRTEFSELLILLRRIVVLSVAALGLFREVPYLDLAARLAILWASVYLSGLLLELAVKYYHHRVATSSVMADGTADETTGTALVTRERKS